MVDFGFYFVIAFCGYFSTFQLTDAIVLERDPTPVFHEKHDYFMVVSVIAILLVIFVSEPVNYNPFRNQIVFMRSGDRMIPTNKENMVITIPFTLATAALAILFPKIKLVFSLMGGVGSVTMSYLIPTYAFVKLSDQPVVSKRNLPPIIFFGVLIVIGYISVVITLIEIVQSFN
jgi:amino acid permease